MLCLIVSEWLIIIQKSLSTLSEMTQPVRTKWPNDLVYKMTSWTNATICLTKWPRTEVYGCFKCRHENAWCLCIPCKIYCAIKCRGILLAIMPFCKIKEYTIIMLHSKQSVGGRGAWESLPLLNGPCNRR